MHVLTHVVLFKLADPPAAGPAPARRTQDRVHPAHREVVASIEKAVEHRATVDSSSA